MCSDWIIQAHPNYEGPSREGSQKVKEYYFHNLRHILNFDDPSHILNKKNQFGFSPLYLASKNGNILAVEFLLKHHADALQTCSVTIFLNF